MIPSLLFLSGALKIIIRLYTYVLWARLIIEWIRVFNPSFRPRGAVIFIVELVFTLTDPPIKFFRKVVPPIRLGNLQIDLAWMITLLLCIVLIAFLP